MGAEVTFSWISRLGLFAIGILIGLSAAVTRADTVTDHADVVCSSTSELAIVRFAYAEDREPLQFKNLPWELDEGLSRTPATYSTDCSTPDGREIRVRTGREQAFAYGIGYGNPDLFFSLWVDRRIVLAGITWSPGGASAVESTLRGLVITPDTLIECRGESLVCDAEALDLTQHPVDLVEYPPPGQERPPVGTILVGEDASDPALCHRYLKGGGELLDADGSDWPYIDNNGGFAATIEFSGPPFTMATTSRLALAPVARGGPIYRIAIFGGANHYFDGDIVLIAPADTSTDAITRLTEHADGVEKALNNPPDPEWKFVSGERSGIYPKVPARYVHMKPLQFDGRLYFIAKPTNRDDRPTALLVGFDTDLRPFAVCEFNRVEPNFGVRHRM